MKLLRGWETLEVKFAKLWKFGKLEAGKGGCGKKFGKLWK